MAIRYNKSKKYFSDSLIYAKINLAKIYPIKLNRFCKKEGSTWQKLLKFRKLTLWTTLIDDFEQVFASWGIESPENPAVGCRVTTPF